MRQWIRPFICGLCTTWLRSAQRSGSADSELATKTRMLLRRFPYWSTGHEFISSHAYAAGNLRAAFASAHALAALRPSAATPYILFARCHLAGQQFEEAAKNARKALELDPSNNAAKEELAAALIPLERFAEAYQHLETIPNAQRTPHVHSMTEFLHFQEQSAEKT